MENDTKNYIRRAAEDAIKEASLEARVLLVTGARQVGKSTLLKHLAAEEEVRTGRRREIVSLRRREERELAKTDPRQFFLIHRSPLLIDEIQYAPELLPEIAEIVDERNEPGLFWLTGSQVFSMMESVTESLAGRVREFHLCGLSDAEIHGEPSYPFTTDLDGLLEREKVRTPMDKSEVMRRIFKGSLPRIYQEDIEDTHDFYDSYIDTYIARDVCRLERIGSYDAFLDFMGIVASNTGRKVNCEEWGAKVGASGPTARKWLEILERSHLVVLVRPYHNNMIREYAKRKILYFMDTGLACRLAGFESLEDLEKSASAGFFFESFVFSEIYKSYVNAGRLRPPIRHFRDLQKREIDLVIHQNGLLHPIEVKLSGAGRKEDVRNFRILEEAGGDFADDAVMTGLEGRLGSGCLICNNDRVFPIDRMNTYVPAWVI